MPPGEGEPAHAPPESTTLILPETTEIPAQWPFENVPSPVMRLVPSPDSVMPSVDRTSACAAGDVLKPVVNLTSTLFEAGGCNPPLPEPHVFHVPSPNQHVEDVAPEPLLKFEICRFPVTPPAPVAARLIAGISVLGMSEEPLSCRRPLGLLREPESVDMISAELAAAVLDPLPIAFTIPATPGGCNPPPEFVLNRDQSVELNRPDVVPLANPIALWKSEVVATLD